MEAGLEHLSRSGGTLAYADVLLVVMEPSRKSVITAARTMALADELGIPQVFAVGNKARPPDDARFFEELAAEYGLRLAGVLPHDPEVATADRQGHMLRGGSEDLRRAIDQVVDRLEDPGAQREALLRQRDELDRRLAQLSGSA